MQEKITVIFENEKIKIERIESYGLSGADGVWYDSALDEWVTLTSGSAVLEIKNKADLRLEEGGNYYIPAHEKHRVKSTSKDCEWLCVYLKI